MAAPMPALQAAPPAPPPLTDEQKAKLAADPWDDAEREVLLGWLRRFPPHTPLQQGVGFMVNEKLFKTTDRWIAIAKQHNFPPPTKEEQEDYDLRQQERENLSAAEKKKRKPEVFPAQKRNRNPEALQAQMPLLYALKKKDMDMLLQPEKEKLTKRVGKAFKYCSALQAKRVSQKWRTENADENRALYYGEVDPVEFGMTIHRIRGIYAHSAAQPPAKNVFYDVGSGAGKAAFAALLAVPFQEVCGVETIDDVYKLSEDIKKRYETKVLPGMTKLERDLREKTTIKFICADGLDTAVDWPRGTIVLFHATMFSQESLRVFADHTEFMEVGSGLIMISKPLMTTQSKWVMLFEDSIALAWGDARMFVYEKLTIEVSIEQQQRLEEANRAKKAAGQGSNAAAGAVSEAEADSLFGTGEGGVKKITGGKGGRGRRGGGAGGRGGGGGGGRGRS